VHGVLERGYDMPPRMLTLDVIERRRCWVP
jgi:hypothetical protein